MPSLYDKLMEKTVKESQQASPSVVSTPRSEQPTNQQTGLHANLQARKPASTQTDKQVSLQTSLHANLQTSKDVSKQAGKPTNKQTGKLVSLQSGKQVFIEKYSSYLPHEHKKELKRIALESDRKEYEVLLEAVEHYLARQKKSQ
jgi:hypothetical protein